MPLLSGAQEDLGLVVVLLAIKYSVHKRKETASACCFSREVLREGGQRGA